jgi:hypothetical protein
MRKYKVILLFTDLDNTLFTSWKTKMSFDIETDDYTHATLMGMRLQKVMEADHFEIEEI